jgi:hypothetical protein
MLCGVWVIVNGLFIRIVSGCVAAGKIQKNIENGIDATTLFLFAVFLLPTSLLGTKVVPFPLAQGNEIDFAVLLLLESFNTIIRSAY